MENGTSGLWELPKEQVRDWLGPSECSSTILAAVCFQTFCWWFFEMLVSSCAGCSAVWSGAIWKPIAVCSFVDVCHFGICLVNLSFLAHHELCFCFRASGVPLQCCLAILVMQCCMLFPETVNQGARITVAVKIEHFEVLKTKKFWLHLHLPKSYEKIIVPHLCIFLKPTLPPLPLNFQMLINCCLKSCSNKIHVIMNKYFFSWGKRADGE